MDASINLVNSSELKLTEEQLLLRGIPASINLGTLSEDALRLLVYYLAKQGPYELASTSGFFNGSLSQWLESLKANLTLKASVKYYNDALKLKGLQEGDLIYVSETDLVYLYDGNKIPAKKDGIKLSGLSTYQIAVKNGYLGSEAEWVEDSKGKPLKFEELTEEQKKELTGIGKSAYDLALETGFTGSLSEWLETLKGNKGEKGDTGLTGASAYQSAVTKGFKGTEEQWLNTLIGKDGKQGSSAYEAAVLLGYKDSLENWLKTLEGKSAYDLSVEQGFEGSAEEWLTSLKGISAYQQAVVNGFVGDETAWLNSLKGDSSYTLAVQKGFKGSEEEWLSSLKGKSAYDLALETGFVGDTLSFLESLKGAPGKSAYDLDVAQGYTGSLEEWLALKNEIPLKNQEAKEYALQSVASASSAENSLKEVQILKESLHKYYLELFQAKADSEVNVAKVTATLLKTEEYVIRIQKALIKISEDVSKNMSYSFTSKTSAESAKDSLKKTIEIQDKVQKNLLEVLETKSLVKSFLAKTENTSSSLLTLKKEVENISLRISNQLASFEVLKEELKTFYKEDTYILTESGLSLRDYLKYIDTKSEKAVEKLEEKIEERVLTVNNKKGKDVVLTTTDILTEDGTSQEVVNNILSKKVSSINGKEGVNITLTREDINFPTDEQLALQKKEDQFVITKSGRTQREKNSDCISLHDYCKLNNTDETQSFLDAISEARAENKKLVAYSGTIKISQDVNLRLLDFNLSGLTIRCKDSSKVVVGWDAGTAISKTVYLGTVYNDSGFKLDPNQIITPSVYLLGSKDYTLHWVAIDRMDLYVTTDPTTYPKDASIAYCNFYGGLLVRHDYTSDSRYTNSVQADGAGSANQWINSNMWYVSRMMGVTIDGSYRHNGNIYHSPTFENDTSYIRINCGNKNHFLNIRGENSPEVYFGEKTAGNIVQRCWYSAASNINLLSNFTDLGRQNKFVCTQAELAQVFDIMHINKDSPILFNKQVGNYAGRVVTQRAIVGRQAGRIIYDTEPFDIDAKDVLYFSCDSISETRSQYAVRIYLYDKFGQLIQDADDSWRSGANFNDSFLSSGFFLGSFSSDGQTWFNLLGEGLNRVRKISVMLLNTTSGVSQSANLRITLSSWRDKYSRINTNIVQKNYYNFVTEKPTECIAPIGTFIPSVEGASYFVSFFLRTKITEVNSTSVIRCNSTSISGLGSVKIGDLIGIDLADDTTHWTTISGISSGLLTILTPIPSSVNVGDTVYISRLV